MKKINQSKLFLFISLLWFSNQKGNAQNISNSVLNSCGTSFSKMDVNIGEPITGLITDGNHQITQGFLQPNLNTIDLKVYLQGFYTGQGFMDNYGIGGCLYATGNSSNTTDADTIRLALINPLSHNEVESVKEILQTDGSASFDFHNAPEGNYYLKVNHRNSIETWSANPVSLNVKSLYDFTIDGTRAYGSNMVETFDNMGWAFYSGDISDSTLRIGEQDGNISNEDYSRMENAVDFIFKGYIPEDITGDGVVESSDFSLMENNVDAIIFSMHP